MEAKKQQKEIRINVDESVIDGKYVNFLAVLHNQAEFIMDFGRLVPGKPDVKVISRLITNPLALKQIVKTLQENLENYEKMFGPVPLNPIFPDKKAGIDQ